MTLSNDSRPSSPLHSAGWAWAWFLPLAIWVSVRWVVNWMDGRHPAPEAWRLDSFEGARTLGQMWTPWMIGLAIAALVLCALVFSVCRWGAVRAGRIWVFVWAVACLWAAGRDVQQYQYARELHAVTPIHAQILGSHFKVPNLRNLGGTLLVLQVEDVPYQVLLQTPEASQWKAGQMLSLSVAIDPAGQRWVRSWALESPSPALSSIEESDAALKATAFTQ